MYEIWDFFSCLYRVSTTYSNEHESPTLDDTLRWALSWAVKAVWNGLPCLESFPGYWVCDWFHCQSFLPSRNALSWLYVQNFSRISIAIWWVESGFQTSKRQGKAEPNVDTIHELHEFPLWKAQKKLNLLKLIGKVSHRVDRWVSCRWLAILCFLLCSPAF